jgi:purine-nucleoside phosphorylase
VSEAEHGADDDALRAAAAHVRSIIGSNPPDVAIVLGSGLSGLSARIEDAVTVPYADIPALPRPTVVGHAGSLTAGILRGRRVLAFGGRAHLYEGHAPHQATIAVRLAHSLGAQVLLVSNAAGGINPSFIAGDLMLIADHINLMWRNPLTGPQRPTDSRFPDMSLPYDPELAAAFRTAARTRKLRLMEGVYAAVAGPSYETPAEVRMLQKLGADAVGMSTVPEVIAARAMGMRVAGISCITNAASGLSHEALSHQDVLETSKRVAADFENLVIEWVSMLPVRKETQARRETPAR